MVKMAAPMIAPVFTVIYNKSINTGIVAYILNVSRITPIYKSGIETEANNYRPKWHPEGFRLVHVQVYSLARKFNTFWRGWETHS